MRGLAPGARIELLPNGYDLSDNPTELPTADRNAPLKIFYLGTIYPGLNYPHSFLKAFAKLENTTFTVAGRYPEDLKKDIARLGIENRVALLGYLSREEALRAARNSDIMLLYIDSRPLNLGQITSKTYEYLGLGKPILACLPLFREAAGLLKKYPTHYIVNPDDEKAMEEKIGELIRLKRENKIPKNTPPQEFDRKYIAEKWIGFIRQTI